MTDVNQAELHYIELNWTELNWEGVELGVVWFDRKREILVLNG